MVMWYGTKANIAPCGLSHSSIYQTQTIISDLFHFQGDIFLKIFQKEQKGFFFIGNIQLSVLSIFVQLHSLATKLKRYLFPVLFPFARDSERWND